MANTNCASLKIPGEYAQVSKHLYALGVGHEAHAAHQIPVTPRDAQEIISRFCGTDTLVAYRGRRGRANWRRNTITLPAAAGTWPTAPSVPYLRLGIVLHEVAHILARRKHGRGIKPHGTEFCRTFANLLREY